jgi:hypothetical protein
MHISKKATSQSTSTKLQSRRLATIDQDIKENKYTFFIITSSIL